MKYCTKCGAGIHDEAVICIHCGNQTKPKSAQDSYPVAPEDVAKNLREWEKITNIIWIVIGVLQCGTLIGTICGVYNIIMAIRGLKNAKYIQAGEPWVISYYENQLTSIIVAMILNVIHFNILGVALIIFDFVIRGYALNHKYAFS